MTEETFEEFYKAACERFGEEKFTIKPIQISEEELAEFNKQGNAHVTLEQLQSVQEVWLMKDECPHCGADLKWSFTWGIVHGYGTCSDCHRVTLKYYHYFGDSRTPVGAYSLVGF